MCTRWADMPSFVGELRTALAGTGAYIRLQPPWHTVTASMTYGYSLRTALAGTGATPLVTVRVTVRVTVS